MTVVSVGDENGVVGVEFALFKVVASSDHDANGDPVCSQRLDEGGVWFDWQEGAGHDENVAVL